MTAVSARLFDRRPGRCITTEPGLENRSESPGGVPLKSGYKAVHPCSLCGRPTRSAFPMCQRRDTPCNPEYQRFRDRLRRESRNESVRRRRQAQKGRPSVYAVWFPIPQGLKVGYTTDTNDSFFVCMARRRALHRGWEVGGSHRIWKRPGDMRTEAWMQATLAFRWPAAFEQQDSRICEWFLVPGLTGDEIGRVLDEVYALVPVDGTEQPVATLF